MKGTSRAMMLGFCPEGSATQTRRRQWMKSRTGRETARLSRMCPSRVCRVLGPPDVSGCFTGSEESVTHPRRHIHGVVFDSAALPGCPRERDESEDSKRAPMARKRGWDTNPAVANAQSSWRPLDCEGWAKRGMGSFRRSSGSGCKQERRLSGTNGQGATCSPRRSWCQSAYGSCPDASCLRETKRGCGAAWAGISMCRSLSCSTRKGCESNLVGPYPWGIGATCRRGERRLSS